MSGTRRSNHQNTLSGFTTGLKFVNVSSSGYSDGRGDRRLVRSNAMRHFHATKRHTLVAGFRETTHPKQVPGNRIAKLQKEDAPVRIAMPTEGCREWGCDDNLALLVERSEQTSTRDDIFDRYTASRRPFAASPLTAMSRLDGSRVTSLNGYLGSGRTDPFLTYPLPTSDIGKSIIDYYITVICPAHDRLGPPRFKTDNIFNVWLPKAMTSTILFASLLMAASRALMDLYSENRYNVYALYYKDIVLKLLREDVLNSANHVSDEALAALLSIKWEEFGTGDMVAYNVHNRAIAQFVRLRGGLESLGMRGLLAHVINSHDLGEEKFFPMEFNHHHNSANCVSGAKGGTLELSGELEGVKPISQAKIELPSYYELMFAQYRRDRHD